MFGGVNFFFCDPLRGFCHHCIII